MKEGEITLRDKLASLVSAMGYEFVGCELQRQGRYSVLRVYIDKENGITLDDCTRVSHQASAMLDVLDPIQGQYSLEVSSPGVDRPLFEIAHYQKLIGNEIKVRLHTPLNGRRKFVGMLLRVEGMNVHIQVDGEEIVLPFSSIEKANVCG